MAFADVVKSDFQAALVDGLAETIEYQSVPESGAEVWRPISAFVREGDSNEPLQIGTYGRAGPQPVRLWVAKDPTLGVAAIRPRFDRVKLHPGTEREAIYTVAALLQTHDPGAWLIHAVPQ